MRKKMSYSIILSMLLVLVTSVSVFADSIPEGYYRIQNVLSGLYLDCAGYNVGSNIRQEKPLSTMAGEKFLVLNSANGYSTIHPAGAQQLAVDVDGAIDENNRNIQLYTSNGTDAQKWKFLSNNNGSFRIMSKCSQDKRGMTVAHASLESGANVLLYDYNATKNDMWLMEACFDRAKYYIRNKETGLYLTVSNVGIYNADLKLAAFGQGINQQFKLSANANGYYDIAPMADTNLSIYVGSNENNANVLCVYGGYSEGQLWKAVLNGDNTFRLVSDITNFQKAITVKGSVTDKLYSCDYTINANNKWEIVKAGSL